MPGRSGIGYQIVACGAALSLLAASFLISAETSKPIVDAPLWRITTKRIAEISLRFPTCWYCVQADFIDDSTLAVTILISDSVDPPGKRRSPNPPGPYRYRTILLGADSGQVRATHDWENGLADLRITPTHDGKFIAETFGQVALYSEAFVELHRMEFKEPGFLTRNFDRVAVSWDGRSLALASSHDGQISAKLYDADTFQLISTSSGSVRSHMWLLAASSDRVAVSAGDEVSITSDDQIWRTIYTSPKSGPLSILSVNFANNDLLLMARGNRVVATDPSGKQLFKFEFDAKQPFLSTRSSRGGHAFAVRTDKLILAYQSQFAIPDSVTAAPDQVAVYDSRDGQEIYRRAVRTEGEHPYINAAISPDAKYLAILSGGSVTQPDGVVQVFRLPHVDGVN
jgi:hypothetical protein